MFYDSIESQKQTTVSDVDLWNLWMCKLLLVAYKKKLNEKQREKEMENLFDK